ncbi:hypothetical protein FACS189454_03210 [Planctomycetales bacterium]|nr:hypothetical protein FACS189454_03210 [Planctomycetales bacterium]
MLALFLVYVLNTSESLPLDGFHNTSITTMPFFYYDSTGTRQGPVSREELQALADQGEINPQTRLETESGHSGTAGQIPGLFPANHSGSGSEEYFYYDSQTAERKGPYNQQELKSLAKKGTIKRDTILETPNGETVAAGSITGLWGDDFWHKHKNSLLEWLLKRIPIRKIAVCTVLVLFAVFAAVFAFQWLFASGPFEIDKPTSWLIARADKGNPRACVQLINYYGGVLSGRIHSVNVEGNPVEKVRKYAKKGMKGDDNDPYTQICKGYAYLTDDSVKDDADAKDNLERALKAFYKAAEAGDSEGSVEGAVVFATQIEGVLTKYENYHRGEVDNLSEYARRYKEQAGEWLMKAAEQGHTRAQYHLGLYSAVGNKIGILKDDQEAIKWIYKTAAQRNTLENNLALGFAALLEDVSGRDAKKAFSLLCKRANGGWLDLIYKRKPAKEELPNLAVLQCFIAHYYDEGIGGAKENKARAFEWYKKAAETTANDGLIANDAQFHIAQAYDNGEGVSEDKAAALKQYRKAADAGNILAQYRIAQMYDEGEGVKEDRDEAKLWYRKVVQDSHNSSLLSSIGNLVVLENIKTFRNKVKEEEQRIQIAREKSEEKARSNRQGQGGASPQSPARGSITPLNKNPR